MRIVFETNIKVLQEKAGKTLSELLLGRKKEPTLLLLAGGSAFGMLDFIETEAFGDFLTVAMGDERFTKNDAENNFAQLEKTRFCTNAKRNDVVFIDSKVKTGDTLQAYSEKLADKISQWMKKNPKGEIIATFGIGRDGHIAGIMPYPEDKLFFENLFEGSELFVGYDADKKTDISLRTTVTFSFIRKYIKKALVYATGQEKKAAFLKVFSTEGDLAETPARIIREIPEAVLFTDLPLFMLKSGNNIN